MSTFYGGGIAEAYAAATSKLESYNPFIDIQKRVVVVENINGAGEKWIRGCQTNHIMVLRNCADVSFYVSSNQRVNTFYLINCNNVSFTILDSVVIANRTVRAINCQNCTFVFEDVDVRHFECYGVTNSKAIYIDSPPVVENSKVHWRSGCGRNLVQLGRLRPRGSDDTPHAINYDLIDIYPVPDVPVDGECVSYFDELQHLHHTSFGPDPKLAKAADIIKDLEDLEKIPFNLTKEELSEAYDRERDEYEEPIESLREKVKEVAKILKESKHSIVYTGAGISTSANIPDFRGPQGVWTLKAKGMVGKGFSDDDIRPTFAHYAVTELARRNLVNFVISTNMDALHMRSGLPRHLICEQHGNGNKEVCVKCRKAFYRQYRTSYSTDFFTHHTGRLCDFCGGNLRDTIVNFSEVLAEEDMHTSLLHARKSEAALVLGTSMNVQPAASFPDKCFRNNGKLVIVNLQKTPYDAIASVRIYAKTDNFMQLLMEELAITNFDQTTDAIAQWDAPDDDTPMPITMRKKYEAQQKREMMWKWAGIAAASIVVVAGVGIGWWIRKHKL